MIKLHMLCALLCTVLTTGCTNSIKWDEEVLLQSGEVLKVRREALTQPFGQIGGSGGWENMGMTLTVISPDLPDKPVIWRARFVPMILDRDPKTREWFIVATFYSCTSWYELGRPKLPYTQFRLQNGQWIQQPLGEEFIGRQSNLLTDIRSSGEPDHSIASKEAVMSNGKIVTSYVKVVAKWQTNC